MTKEQLEDALYDELQALQIWQTAEGLPEDVAQGIEISIDKIERCLLDVGRFV